MYDKRNDVSVSAAVAEKQQSLENALNNAKKEKQMFNALCINYTAAYYCDLMNDYLEPIKQKNFSHSAKGYNKLHNKNSYSEWIRYAYEHILIKETAQDYLDTFEAHNLMEHLKNEESLVYRHMTKPNSAGMEYFEATVVRLYADEHSFKVIVGYRPIDTILKEEMQRQKQLEEALRTAEIANRSKTEFLRRMSHDIRTPLNGIIGLLEVDEAHFDDMELIKANHEKMKISANHLLSLINDVLQMSKLEDGTIELAHEPISLMDMTKEIVLIVVDRAIDTGIRWEYESDKSVIPYPYIYGSPLHLRQIFLNVYGNCIKYNRPGGKINTIVQDAGEKDGICTYRWIISDTGIGMSQEFLDHIFEPFAQEKNDARSIYQGTGLGMAIVKKLIDKMGGNISITSKEGVGSTFVIELPFEIAPAPLEQTEQLPDSECNIRGLHLLLAEDNELNAEIAQMLLNDEGAEVTIVSDGRQAVDAFKSGEAGKFDAILMDVMMPVMDGIAATKAIRTLERPDAKTIPIISMTANAFKEDAQECIDAGMNEHLAKPLKMDEVVETIVKLCRKR
ncbi:response regulator [Eubacterium sp. MSJ-13]|uniref:ATP-binding protein n=1 Tax=Eubacterium sp. MSJ-13 TaxID=2841513 RepID=UPI001C0F6154|nr:ATP-binding protein [Eubacterium sp. MSJ-13]MBU5479083.1 response regulator [Eubacterium sp. MSJ-13]